MKDETETRQTAIDREVVDAAMRGAADLIRETLGTDIALCFIVVDPTRNQRQMLMGGRCECGHHDIHLLRMIDDAQRVIMSGEPSRATRFDPAASDRVN